MYRYLRHPCLTHLYWSRQTDLHWIRRCTITYLPNLQFRPHWEICHIFKIIKKTQVYIYYWTFSLWFDSIAVHPNRSFNKNALVCLFFNQNSCIRALVTMLWIYPFLARRIVDWQWSHPHPSFLIVKKIASSYPAPCPPSDVVDVLCRIFFKETRTCSGSHRKWHAIVAYRASLPFVASERKKNVTKQTEKTKQKRNTTKEEHWRSSIMSMNVEKLTWWCGDWCHVDTSNVRT